MRFSVEKKFIFLANPKTGSTSMRKILNEYSEHNKLKALGKYHDHWTAQLYMNIFIELGYDWFGFFKFINIRNPWDKYVSNYHFSKPDSKFKPFYNEAYDKSAANSVSFNDWVKYHLNELKEPPQGCPRVDRFAGDSDGNLLVDDIFPIESFAEKILPKLLKRLDLNINTILPVLNKTKRDNYRSYFDDQSRKLVADFCYLDIEYGKYRF